MTDKKKEDYRYIFTILVTHAMILDGKIMRGEFDKAGNIPTNKINNINIPNRANWVAKEAVTLANALLAELDKDQE